MRKPKNERPPKRKNDRPPTWVEDRPPTENRSLNQVDWSPLSVEIDGFLLDRKSRSLSIKTIGWYEHSLCIWRAQLETQAVTETAQVTATDLRHFLVALRERGHNPGGVSNIFRAVKAYLRCYELEPGCPPADWKNPLRTVKSPRVPSEPIAPISM